jgi:hypothetical protein
MVKLVTSGFREYYLGNEFGFEQGRPDLVPSKQNASASEWQRLWEFDISLPTQQQSLQSGQGAATVDNAAQVVRKTCLDDKLSMDFLSVHPGLTGQPARYVYACATTYVVPW